MSFWALMGILTVIGFSIWFFPALLSLSATLVGWANDPRWWKSLVLIIITTIVALLVGAAFQTFGIAGFWATILLNLVVLIISGWFASRIYSISFWRGIATVTIYRAACIFIFIFIVGLITVLGMSVNAAPLIGTFTI